MTQKTILVVDDDRRLQDLLRRYLTSQGFRVETAVDGAQMDRLLARRHFAALVLDLMLPGEDGLSICRRLRAGGDEIPILVLTAKGDEIDRILGLEMGADDYLPKPFNPRELVARLNAILRRARPGPAAAPEAGGGEVRFGPWVLELDSRRLLRDGEPQHLTSGEFALLQVLARRPNRPLSRDTLLNLAQGREHNPFDRSVDVQISRLRKLLEEDPARPRYIQTVWGVGYVFVPDGERR